jgi:hypothetical protein
LKFRFFILKEYSEALPRGQRGKFEKRMVFHKTKNKLSSFEYLEALPRGLFIKELSLSSQTEKFQNNHDRFYKKTGKRI